LTVLDTDWRQQCLPILLLHADNDISSPKIVKIIGKSADGVQGVQWIPPFFEFQPFPFNGAAVKKIVYVYR
jgi:hypothetical protein